MTARWPMAHRATLIVFALLALVACDRAGDDFNAEDVAANNRGVALMGYFDYSAARDTFDALVQRRPGWHDARLNLAIATLNRQQEGDEQRALEIVRFGAAGRPRQPARQLHCRTAVALSG